MAVTDWLIDSPPWGPEERLRRRRVGWSHTTRLRQDITTLKRPEVGSSARTAARARSTGTTPPISIMRVECLMPAIEDRALEE